MATARTTATSWGLLELTRPVNAVVSGALALIGAYVAVGADGVAAHAAAVGAACAATVLAVGAGNAVNDYFDREIDRVNDPDRPIPRGVVAPRTALAFAAVLFAAAVTLALTLPIPALAIAGINLVALIAYTELFKGLPGVGNAVVAYLGGSTFLFGGAAVGSFRAVGTLAALAACSTLAREIVKDVEDVAGDRAEGLNTLPIALGERPALWVAAALSVLAVAASPVPYATGTFGPAYLAVVAPADFLLLYATCESFGDPAAGQTRMKYGMFLAAAAFLAGRALGG